MPKAKTSGERKDGSATSASSLSLSAEERALLIKACNAYLARLPTYLQAHTQEVQLLAALLDKLAKGSKDPR